MSQLSDESAEQLAARQDHLAPFSESEVETDDDSAESVDDLTMAQQSASGHMTWRPLPVSLISLL